MPVCHGIQGPTFCHIYCLQGGEVQIPVSRLEAK